MSEKSARSSLAPAGLREFEGRALNRGSAKPKCRPNKKSKAKFPPKQAGNSQRKERAQNNRTAQSHVRASNCPRGISRTAIASSAVGQQPLAENVFLVWVGWLASPKTEPSTIAHKSTKTARHNKVGASPHPTHRLRRHFRGIRLNAGRGLPPPFVLRSPRISPQKQSILLL